MIRVANTSTTAPQDLHCFYIDANSHCSGSFVPGLEGSICTDSSTCGGGVCVPAWLETDFYVRLTVGQPFEWRASDADVTVFDPDEAPGGLDKLNLPLPSGRCQRDITRTCGTDNDCAPFPGGACTQSNGGTAIPPVPEDPFVGELKCIATDVNGVPQPNNVLKGEALIETVSATIPDIDVASYNAIGIQATGNGTADNVLVIGGDNPEYNACPGVLILNHFFDDADDPVPGTDDTITTDLTLVPCSEDLLRQIPGAAVAQYLVFNEFEQRFSTSNTVKCFLEQQLCSLDHNGGTVSESQCSRSIFNVATAGTLTGQTRITPVSNTQIPFTIPSGLLGVAIESHHLTGTDITRSAAFNIHFQGVRSQQDVVIIP